MIAVTPTRLYLAQLMTAQAADVRRVAVPSEAFEGGERDIYRAVRSVAAERPLVTLEAVVTELREAGRLETAGGADGVDSLTDLIGAHTLDGARVELVAHASQRLLMEAGRASHAAAREGRTREATEAMQAALRLVQSMDGMSRAVPLKTERQHIADWAADLVSERQQVRVDMGGLTAALGVMYPGTLGLIYGESQAGKSFGMQYLERRYLEAGYTTLRVSCEDAERILRGRLVSERAGIDAMSDEALTRDDMAKAQRALAAMDSTADKRIVVEHGADVEAICQTMRTAAVECGARVVLIDYAQLLRMASRGKNEETQERILAGSTAAIKTTAKECGQMVWLGSQVTITRDAKRKFFKPTEHDTKGGKVLYDMAELAIAIWREDEDNRFVQIQKNKINGKRPTARVEVGPGGIIRALHAYTPRAEAPQQNPYARYQDA